MYSFKWNSFWCSYILILATYRMSSSESCDIRKDSSFAHFSDDCLLHIHFCLSSTVVLLEIIITSNSDNNINNSSNELFEQLLCARNLIYFSHLFLTLISHNNPVRLLWCWPNVHFNLILFSSIYETHILCQSGY